MSIGDQAPPPAAAGKPVSATLATSNPTATATRVAPPSELANFDLSVNPGDHFYDYVNKGWTDKNPIPGDKSRWGTFEQLSDQNDLILKDILEGLSKAPTKTLLGEFYLSAMDEALVEKAGLDPVKEILNKIDTTVKTPADVVTFVATLHKKQIGEPLWHIYVESDAKNAGMQIIILGQGGLGMPDRDYYFDEDDTKKETRIKYRTYMAALFQLEDPTRDASQIDAMVDAVYAIEETLAQSFWTRIERRDPERMYNITTISELAKTTQHIPWAAYFENVGYADEAAFGTKFSVECPNSMKKLDELLMNVDIEHWRHYLRFHILKESAPYLSDAFVNASFEFEQKTLTGQAQIKPRWQRVRAAISDFIPDTLSQPYVERVFPKEAKSQLNEYVEYVRSALRQRLEALDWMQDKTKVTAFKKLEVLKVKVGYPDRWEKHDGPLEKSVAAAKPYYENIRLVAEADQARKLAKAGKPIDWNDWLMPSFMVNAYFDPSRNEMAYPAAILQPPMFYPPTPEHPEGYPAFSFGAIGAVIGHEATHSYDDQGSQYDESGNLRNWWAAEDRAEFERRAKVMIEQYNEYIVHGQHVKGELTQGENIADLGGLKIAFLAMQKYMHDKGRLPDYTMTDDDGTKNKTLTLTPEQQFFVSAAQLWRNNITKENALMRITLDPHAPGVYRVLGPLANLPEFWAAFDVKENQPMRRPADKIVQIW
ncbi:hypothetical protein DFJ77DRAFT_471223 [Powellomyces hirtus]|nr:hypothetical protein DFJ77DRAFT_471223 [Powellomyces hirtus]